MDAAAAALLLLIASREGGALSTTYQEVKVEAQVLRGAIPVDIVGVGRLNVATPGESPTLWSDGGGVGAPTC